MRQHLTDRSTGRRTPPRCGDGDLLRWRIVLGVVPDEQSSRSCAANGPGPGARQFGDAPRVGHQCAAAGAVPPPVVERAGHRVALDRSAAEVSAHVAAVGVQHVQGALTVLEHHDLVPKASTACGSPSRKSRACRGSANRARNAFVPGIFDSTSLGPWVAYRASP